MRRRIGGNLALLAFLACRGAEAPHTSANTDASASTSHSIDQLAADSARQFVQRFYDWYVPLGDRAPDSRYDSVLIGHATFLAPELRQALLADAHAQQHSQEIVSVVGDYDPFLNSQDPCPRYEARSATATTIGVSVAVYGICVGDSARIAVLADVTRDSTGWRFANFHHPESPATDLLTELRAAAAQRRASSTPGPAGRR